jgi:hypothetical protein
MRIWAAEGILDLETIVDYPRIWWEEYWVVYRGGEKLGDSFLKIP